MKTTYSDNIKHFDVKMSESEVRWCHLLASAVYSAGLISVDPMIEITAGVSLAFKRGRFINERRLRRFLILGCTVMIWIGQIIGYAYAYYTLK